MIGPSFKFALKSVKRHRVPSLINGFGFAIGIVGAIVLFAILKHDLFFDTYHEKHDRIYRLSIALNLPNNDRYFASTSVMTAEGLVDQIPELEQFTRVRLMPATLRVGDNTFNNEPISYVDQGFYEMFTTQLVAGAKPSTPNEIIISTSAKERIFGEEEAVGKVISSQSQTSTTEHIVAGVFDSFPTNVSFRPSILADFGLIEQIHNRNYGAIMPYLNTFLLTNGSISMTDLQNKLDAFYLETLPENLREVLDHQVELYSDMHYTSNKEFDFPAKHDQQTQWVLLILASFILLSTLVNYFNMQSALMVQRFKELSIKAAIGQTFLAKLRQTIFESLILLFPAVAFSGLGVHLILIELEAYTNLSLRTDWLSPDLLPILMLAMLLFLWLVTIIISVTLMKVHQPNLTVSRSKPGNSVARRVLIGFQFALAGFFILNALVISKQLRFVNEMDLGFEQAGMINIPLQGFRTYEQIVPIKNSLLSVAGVRSVTATQSSIFGDQGKANFSLRKDTSNISHLVNLNFIDEDFIETTNVILLAGEDIEPKSSELLVNQRAAELFGFVNLQDALGKQVTYTARDTIMDFKISGVVGDYHYSTMHQQIEPIVLLPSPIGGYYHLSVRTETKDYDKVIGAFENEWEGLFPGFQFNYTLMEDSIGYAYEEDFQKAEFYQWSTLLLVIIASLGIFGLTYYYADQKRKEIGVRKAIGARLKHIVLQIAKPISWICLLALIVSMPLAYYAAQKWLNGYEYTVQIGVDSIIITIMIMFALSMIALLYPGFKAAHINPVDSLREE